MDVQYLVNDEWPSFFAIAEVADFEGEFSSIN
jgi:hypothetical protein